MGDLLAEWYLWTKALHVTAVISWMAGLFYCEKVLPVGRKGDGRIGWCEDCLRDVLGWLTVMTQADSILQGASSPHQHAA